MIEILLAMFVSGVLPLDTIDFELKDGSFQPTVFCTPVPESGRSLCLHVQISVLGDDTVMLKAVGDLFLNRAGEVIPPLDEELRTDDDAYKDNKPTSRPRVCKKKTMREATD